MWEEKKSDFQHDVHLVTWLKPFRNNSISHVLKMAIFYHLLGLMIASLIVGTFYVFDPSYELPFIPYILTDFILAGPIEETVFFGLPFYLTGNQWVMLFTASIWALIHLPVYDETSEDFVLIDLNYAMFANAVTTLFFSYRAWMSGKGWLSIIVHSVWNGSLFGIDCTFDETVSCSVFGDTVDDVLFSVSSISVSLILLIIMYFLYRWRKKKQQKTLQ